MLDSACSLTGARYGVITLLDDSGRIEDFVTSGLTAEERQRFVELPEGLKLFEHLSRITEPLRLRDFHSHTRALGLPEFRPPMAVSPVLTFLAAPIRHLGESVGAFYVGEKDVEFTPEDEETLVMFASQAALVIANARRHREERRARTGLETLVNTTPVGVLIFDARKRSVVLNRWNFLKTGFYERIKIGSPPPPKYMRPFLRFTPLHRIAGMTMLVWPLSFTDAGALVCLLKMLRRQDDIACICDRCHRSTVHFGQAP